MAFSQTEEQLLVVRRLIRELRLGSDRSRKRLGDVVNLHGLRESKMLMNRLTGISNQRSRGICEEYQAWGLEQTAILWSLEA